MRAGAVILLAALSLSCACRPKRAAAGGSGEVQEPAPYTYRIVNVYPHDRGSYTQGLFWHDGRLWESTGIRGRSHLMEVDLETGKALRSVPARGVFAEGAAILDGTIWQLTWNDGVAFAYDAATLERTGRFPLAGEGWGLTTDGRQLYMSDGTSRITVVSPDGFRRQRSFNVRAGRSGVRQLNELEWIDGRIWANIYMTDLIAIIDPEDGRVEGIVDLGGLLPAADHDADTDVLNGIAHDPATGRIFVTGKHWPKLFEIELVARMPAKGE